MNAKTTRILKEARPLFWPWCAVAAAGVLPLAHPPQLIELIWLIGFFLGIPLLTTLSLGNEFQHRTLPLLLSQPVGRMVIWGEKLSVTVVAVLSAVLFFSLTMRETSFWQDWRVWAFGGAWIVAITASATFWTLFTRSTVGGVVLNIGVQSFIGFTVPWANLAAWLRARGYLSPGNPIVVSTVAFVFLCYAGVMVWLGRRTLARFQATGGMASDDLLMAGPDVMPGAWAGWLRCRPTGAVLNLIRKELRLLRPVWLISLLAALGWACLNLFGLLFERGFSRNFETAVVIVGVVSTLMIAILAGSVSLGEERTSGTHSWHMTLPVSARRQWLIKLCVALFAGWVGAGLLPLLIAGRILFGASRILVDVHFGMDWLFVVLILTFASFWCACAVNGTVPAVLWVLPVMIALYFAGELGKWAGPALTHLFFSRFDPFANLKFAHAVSSMFETFPMSRSAFWEFFYNRGYLVPMVWAVLVPTLFLAVIQSYRLFRAQLQDSALSLVRNLLPLAVVTFLCSFSLMAFFPFVIRARNQESIALFETIRAIEKVQSGAAKLDATHPLQLTVEDLAQAYPLSKSTRRFLGDSHVTLVLDEPPHHGHFGCAENSQPSGLQDLGYSWYSATIPLADGSHFEVAFDPVHHSFISAGICK
jgi:branched-subunit amino acid transport protein